MCNTEKSILTMEAQCQRQNHTKSSSVQNQENISDSRRCMMQKPGNECSQSLQINQIIHQVSNLLG